MPKFLKLGRYDGAIYCNNLHPGFPRINGEIVINIRKSLHFRLANEFSIISSMISIKSPYKVKTFLREFSRASNYNAYDLAKGIPLEFKRIEYTVDHPKKTTCLTPKD